jgi:hypothetical protein
MENDNVTQGERAQASDAYSKKRVTAIMNSDLYKEARAKTEQKQTVKANAERSIVLEERDDRCVASTTDENGVEWVNNGSGIFKPESFHIAPTTLEDTANEDDVTKLITINHALFMHLCVQASKDKTLDSQPFQELMRKVKEGNINIHTDTITLTKKDSEHRLLSYIPLSKPHWNRLVNGKKIRILQLLQSVEVDNSSDEEASKAKPHHVVHEYDFEIDDSRLILPKEYITNNHKRTKIIGAEIQSSNYTVTDDKEHHETIVKEFEALLNK